MLDYARNRLNRKKILNVEYHLCNEINLPFSEDQFDVIFIVTVLGEIENKQRYLNEFRSVFRANGLLSISEQAGDPDKPERHEIEDMLKDRGFKPYKFYGTCRNYTINLLKESEFSFENMIINYSAYEGTYNKDRHYWSNIWPGTWCCNN
jgi:ubiquinone/menaquinone biosynthesis C-methylase UbiE